MKNKQKTNKKEETKKIDYPIVLGKEKGKLTLSTRLVEQINTLHNYVGAKEWSGPVLFSIINGDINNPTKLEIEAHAMYPMDIGTSGYTEYDFEPEETFDMHDYYPQIVEEGWRMGHMHTHHNMKAYFSGTDNQELKDNTQNHAYYLSLIVNFEGSYVARLCVMAEKQIKGNSNITYDDIAGDATISTFEIKQEQEIVYAIDLDVVYEKQKESDFMGEVLKIEQREEVRKKERAKNKPTGQSSLWDKSSTFNNNWGANWDMPHSRFDSNGGEEDALEDLAKEFALLVLTRGTVAVGYLPSTMSKVDLEWENANDAEREAFINDIDENFNAWYQQVFADFHMVDFENNMDAVLEEFYKYCGTHKVADVLMEHLEKYSVLIQ
jgi:hypothetical protein